MTLCVVDAVVCCLLFVWLPCIDLLICVWLLFVLICLLRFGGLILIVGCMFVFWIIGCVWLECCFGLWLVLFVFVLFVCGLDLLLMFVGDLALLCLCTCRFVLLLDVWFCVGLFVTLVCCFDLLVWLWGCSVFDGWFLVGDCCVWIWVLFDFVCGLSWCLFVA